MKLKTHHFYSLSGWMEEAEQVEDAGCSFGALRGHPQRSSSALLNKTETLKGRRGKEVIITGGKGREKRVMKLDVKTQKW